MLDWIGNKEGRHDGMLIRALVLLYPAALVSPPGAALVLQAMARCFRFDADDSPLHVKTGGSRWHGGPAS